MEPALKKLLMKLRQPIHVSYIAEHILKKDVYQTMEIIGELMEDGEVIESKYGKGYYILNNGVEK